MKYMAKYSRISNGFVDVIKKQPQPTLYTFGELCFLSFNNNNNNIAKIKIYL